MRRWAISKVTEYIN